MKQKFKSVLQLAFIKAIMLVDANYAFIKCTAIIIIGY